MQSSQELRYPAEVSLPCDNQESWTEVRSALKHLTEITTTEALLSTLGAVYRAAHPSQFSWHTAEPLVETSHPFVGLGHFLEHVASSEERGMFFARALPTIARLAGEIERWRPVEEVRYLVQQREADVSLDRRFVASIIANAFLCTFPKQCNPCLSGINFDEFFQFLICSSTKNSQAAKLRCFLHYFDRLADIDMARGFQGQVTFQRRVLPRDRTLPIEGWLDSKVTLCPVTIRHEGNIEDAGPGAMQVDFANCFIGCGTLRAGRLQEEVRFCTCPEALACLLFTECLQDNEAVVIDGFEPFSKCSGYSSTLECAGSLKDTTKDILSGNPTNTLIVIDAMPWSGCLQTQYKAEHILRELNKAYTGFYCPPAGQLDSDTSSYYDALDQSLTDFETASSGDDFCVNSSSISTQHRYSWLSTETAEEDSLYSVPNVPMSLSRDESSHNSLNTVLSVSNDSTPVDENVRLLASDKGVNLLLGGGGEEDSPESDVRQAPGEDTEPAQDADLGGSCLYVSSGPESSRFRNESSVLDESGADSIATGVSDDVLPGGRQMDTTTLGSNLYYCPPNGDIDSLRSNAWSLIEDPAKTLQRNITSDEVDVHRLMDMAGDAVQPRDPDESLRLQGHYDGSFIENQARTLVSHVISDAVKAISSTPYMENSLQVIQGNHDLEAVSITPIVTSLVEFPGSLRSNSPVVQSQSSGSRSSKDSLADYDVVSSASSGGFVNLAGNIVLKRGSPSQAFSADVLADDILQDVMQTLKHYLHPEDVPKANSADSLNGEVLSETPLVTEHSDSFDILTSGDVSSSPSLSEYVRVAAFSIDGLTEEIMSSAFLELNQILSEGDIELDRQKTSSHTRNHPPNGIELRGFLPLTDGDLQSGKSLPSTDPTVHRSHVKSQRANAANSFAERIVGEIVQESLQSQVRNRLSDDPPSPPPSPTSPTGRDTCPHASQSSDTSLVTISEQPAIEVPQYDGDKRLSADSSGTESSQSREARIRECAEQLVARTLPESMRFLGGSAQTTSSSSSRRSSARSSSIPSGSNRSSMDCFTEDLLKIANIDPMGKRPSRTEESLAFFAQEIIRIAEAEEKSAKKQKEDFADFTIEMQGGNIKRLLATDEPDIPVLQDRTLNSLAERHASDIISHVFVQLYGEPWSEAGHSDYDEIDKEDIDKHARKPPLNSSSQSERRSRRLPTEQDLMSMASNLANSILEAAMKAYREEYLPTALGVSSVEVSRLSLEGFASMTAGDVLQDAFSQLSSIIEERDSDKGLLPGCRPISTGNWGCGAFGGDPQLKSLIQWMAVSLSGSPRMIYCTAGDERVSRLERVVSETKRRHWTVGHLLKVVLDHGWLTLHMKADDISLFERIINCL